MSLLFIDSFDHYTSMIDKWDTVEDAFVNSSVVGRFTPGAHVLAQSGTVGAIIKNLTTTATEGIFGFAHLFESVANSPKFEFLDGSGNRIGLIQFSGGTDITSRDKDDNFVSSASAVLTVGVWQFIEVRIKSHATLGEIEVRIGGVIVNSDFNVDTRGTAIAGFRVQRFANTNTQHMDDLYILDNLGTSNNSFLGDTRITVLRPKANGNNNNFTPTGAATNWETQDETLHDSDVTFVEAGQIAAKDDYTNNTFSDLGIAPGTIFGVQTVNAAKKTDAGQLKYKDQMIIGGVTFDNGTEVIATSGLYKMTTFIRDTDPSDSATWTETKVANTGSGFEITFREV